MKWEVVVVGAGPSGSTVATALAQKGHDVLLLDRQDFPRDKACGDAIPAGATEILNKLGMEQKIKQAEEDRRFYRVTGLRIVSPGGYSLDADFLNKEIGTPTYISPRIHFDVLVQEHAIASGATFCRAQVKEPLIDQGRVVGVRARINGSIKDIHAQLTIAADGVTSVITRALRPKQHVDMHRSVALRAYIDDIDELPHRIEFYLYKQILPGYAWIFPIGKNRANVGVGMRLDKFRQAESDLKDLLRLFLKMPAIQPRLERGGQLRNIKTWQLNFGSQRDLQHAYDGALLVGDAAGFINPLTGGGIENALISSVIAANVADRALTNGDVSQKSLKVYEQLCNEAMWSGMHRSFLFQKWLLHPRVSFLLDLLLKRASANNSFVQTFMKKL